MSYREAMTHSLWIGLGGMFGANARYWLQGWIQSRAGISFPWGTMAVNVSGSFALGLLLAYLAERYSGGHSAAFRLAVGIGFLGGYTTFSTFSYETLQLMQGGSWGRVMGNVAGSVFVGLFAAWAGMKLGRAL